MSDPLSNQPFSYQKLSKERIQIYHNGRIAKILSAREGVKFLQKIVQLESHDAQLLMAKITGQFKFGNERQGRNSNKS